MKRQMDMEKNNTYSDISVPDETTSNSNTLNENQDFQPGAKHINVETADEMESHTSLIETIKDSRGDKNGIEKCSYDKVFSKHNEKFESYGQETGKRDKPSSDSDNRSGVRATEQVADTNAAVNDNCIETSINSFVVTETKSEDVTEQISLAKKAKVSETDNVLTIETNEVVRLTKNNLKRHTKRMHESVKATLSDMTDGNKAIDKDLISGHDDAGRMKGKNKNNEVSRTENSDNQMDNASKTGRPKQKENTIQNSTQHDKVNRSPGKTPVLEHKISPNEEKETLVNYEMSRTQEQGKRKICVNKSQKVNTKHQEKKTQKINVNDIETLVSRHEWSNTENRKFGKNMANETNPWNDSTSQKSKTFSEYSGIGKDIENKSDFGDAAAVHRGKEGDVRIDEGHAFKHKRIIRRSIQPGFMKRPVYDALNTSTQLILLNNKYGKHSRLWKAQETQPNRTSLIDPRRHLRERSFYLSGHFHSRCSISECPTRYAIPSSHLKFDFSGRPKSEKIGDHLYEARHSKNPKRHRTCTSTPEGWLKPLDFSAPNKKIILPVYVFEWERLYAEPPLRTSRPSTSRPSSTVIGRKIGNQTLRVP